jgi:hypothetical protein
MRDMFFLSFLSVFTPSVQKKTGDVHGEEDQ